ncbi:MAG: TPM domain-containing protein [bacterium]
MPVPRTLAALVVLGAAVAGAQDAPAIARFIPPTPNAAHVFVLDSAHVLSAETVAAMQDSARALQAETGADVVWVTLPTLGGRAIEEAALYIGRTWRIGSAGQPGDPLRNRGLVILFVPDKTKTAGSNFRIEVGNGLEGTITDSRSRAISAAMREGLKAKRYDDAYLAGWPVAARLVREDFNAHGVANNTPTPASAPTKSVTPGSDSSFSVGGVIIVAVIGILIGAVVLRSRRSGQGRRRGSGMGFVPIPLSTSNDDDDDARRRSAWQSSDSSSSSSGDSGGSSDSGGGDTGGGGGFSGGGSSDTI